MKPTDNWVNIAMRWQKVMDFLAQVFPSLSVQAYEGGLHNNKRRSWVLRVILKIRAPPWA